MASHSDGESNPFAAPQSDIAPEEFEYSKRSRLKYADFGQRLVAAIIDNVLLRVLGTVVGVAIGALGAASEADESVVMGIAIVIGIVLQWLYYALQESSEAQATVGKKLLGLVVVSLTGERISFGQATGRYFGKLLSTIILLIGYLMQPFTEKKQALHDLLAGTLVIKK